MVSEDSAQRNPWNASKLITKTPDEALLTGTRDIFKTLPVNSNGYLNGTGVSTLDGEVKDAIILIERLAKSSRV